MREPHLWGLWVLALVSLPGVAAAQAGGLDEEEASPAAFEPVPEGEPEETTPIEPTRGEAAYDPPPAPPPAPPRRNEPGLEESRTTGTALGGRTAEEGGVLEDEEEESDDFDFIWLEAFGGVSYVNLRALSQNNYYPELIELTGVGPAFGVAAGFRLWILSIGARLSYATYGEGDASFDVGTIAAEITLEIPTPLVRPWARVGFGYGWHGDANAEDFAMSETSVYGYVIQGGIGLDFCLVSWFRFGFSFNLDILNMSRQALEDAPMAVSDVSFENPGDAVGLQARGQLHAAFHF